MVRCASCLRRLLPVLLAVVVVMPVVSSHQGGEERPPVADVLWFATPSVVLEGRTNLTTEQPSGEGYVQSPRTYPNRALWVWRSEGVPPWHVPEGTEFRLVATVSGMEKTWPLPIPGGNASEPFSASFEADLWRRGADQMGIFAGGVTLVPMDPIHPPEGPIRVEIPLTATEDVTLGPDDEFEVWFHVFARGVKYNSLRVHIMGNGTASHLVAPGFPVEAFRAWEEGVPHDVCQYYRLKGEPCPERWPLFDRPLSEGPTPTATAAESPFAGPVWVLPLVALLGTARRLNRHTVQRSLYGDLRQDGDKA